MYCPPSTEVHSITLLEAGRSGVKPISFATSSGESPSSTDDNRLTIGTGLEARFEKYEPKAAVADYHAAYLSKTHVEKPGIGCPLAALGGDVARGSDALKIAFGTGVNRLVETLARGMEGSPQQRQAKAGRELAMLVGAVVIVRASDPETASSVLAACRTDPTLELPIP